MELLHSLFRVIQSNLCIDWKAPNSMCPMSQDGPKEGGQVQMAPTNTSWGTIFFRKPWRSLWCTPPLSWLLQKMLNFIQNLDTIAYYQDNDRRQNVFLQWKSHRIQIRPFLGFEFLSLPCPLRNVQCNAYLKYLNFFSLKFRGLFFFQWFNI